MFTKIQNSADFLKIPVSNDIGDVVLYTNNLFDYAIAMNASDIHIEPSRTFVSIRFRVHGDFWYISKMSHEDYGQLLSRIKILANLRIDERQKPQDGKITYQPNGQDTYIDIRVSVLPVVYGEKIAMRILPQDISLLALDQRGFLDVNLEKVKEALGSPYGLILVAGPTGSGKSTTLFSMLTNFDPFTHNITTLEDPVEYNVPHINQTQIKPQIGFDFATGLRSLVRQDPDIIMVGEIRDKETAMLALEAALTGHLVLATIHTNSAAATIQRLINMGVEPFLLASALRLVISQRLAKQLCPHCMQPHKITDKAILNKLSDYVEGVLEENLADVDFFTSPGCEACNNLGFSGRYAVHEVFVKTNDMDSLITGKASVSELESVAKANGMLTIVQDGVIKAAMGKIPIEEVFKLA